VATQAQIDANRANARNSTGPTTPEGRAAVRFNGLRHGLRAETAVLPCEDPAEFERFKQEFEAEFQPIGPRERLLVAEIILAGWRLQRASIYDAAISSRLFRSASRNRARRGAEPDDMKAIAAMLHDDAEGKKVLDYVSRIEGRHRRTYQRAVQDLGRLQATRRPQSVVAAEPPPPEPPPTDPPAREQPRPELALVAHAATSPAAPAQAPIAQSISLRRSAPKLALLAAAFDRPRLCLRSGWRKLHAVLSTRLPGIGAKECPPLLSNV
jgi:hypothetical protein